MAVWNPQTYLQFADERSRPFFDLVAQIRAETPTRVVDLGCGPGQLTATLAERWPTAYVEGVDSSPEMIARAMAHTSDRVSFRAADLRAWQPEQAVDVVVSNATLQWVPEHRSLLPDLVAAVTPGGWLAFQVPGNFGAPSHQLLYELAERADYAPYLTDVETRRPTAADPETYLSDLAGLSCSVDEWETTYLHVLTGPDAVFRWISGTGARPILQALPEEVRRGFEREYKSMLDRAYPVQSYGTVLPFRRIFVVAQQVG